MAEGTPMKNQYNEIKKQYGDCLLFFRLGDFYEMFDEDAKTASRELDLALTTRDRGVENPEERTPMCGVPYHAAETYIGRLISKGYKVAICEQMEDPALAKGLVKRDVIRVITPGTLTESSMLDEKRSNYICAVMLNADKGGAAFCDISTGEFCCAYFEKDAAQHIVNELGRFSPKEAVLSAEAEKNNAITEFLNKRIDAMPEPDGGRFNLAQCTSAMVKRFNFSTVAESGIEGCNEAICAVGALLSYIEETQKFDLSHINNLDVFAGGRYMELDWTTRRNLELTESLRGRDKKGSLLWVLDKTKTPMGGRLLRAWIERPLLSVLAIRRRLSAVNELYSDSIKCGEIIQVLKNISDMQRLIGRVVYGTAGGKDLRSLANCLKVLPEIKAQLQGAVSQELAEIAGMDELQDIFALVNGAIADDPPFSVREGGIIREGYSEELDYLRNVRDNGARMVAELENRERERTGIKKLKVGYNKVFGYFIDVPRSVGEDSIPEDYIRKQTLVSNERYFTEELKNLENTLLTARDKGNDMEYRIFSEICTAVASNVGRIQETADKIAKLDVLCSFAEVARKNGYTMPEVDTSKEIEIVEGRHPVVEQTLKDVLFVPNSTRMNDGDDRVAIVTGPNMAGKSTYMRQTALIVLMAQIGSFVPAKSATIGVVDRVFTRIGASDDLASGQSTFMVEMNEMANILKYASSSSLLVLDEIGRGTSTFDGMAIARAVLEYCADKKKLGAKTMFATHYHELSALEGELQGVKNYNITAKKQGENLVFLRKIVRGAADDSYGIEVAKLAGVPEAIISKAKTYLKELEKSGCDVIGTETCYEEESQISFTDMGESEIGKILRGTDINTLTPIEAINLLYELKKKAEA